MRILITAPYNEKAREILKTSSHDIIYRSWKPQGRAYHEQELIDLLQETEAEALITEHDHVTEAVIDLFPHLQFIGVCRGTPSNVHLDTATRHGIPVFYTPARNAQAVAEMFIANVITFLRQTLQGIEWLKEGRWDEGAHTSYLQFKGNELAGKTIGLVGFGAIGQLIAQLTECFPCAIQFFDPYVQQHKAAYKKTSLENLFATSDIISIHLPMNEETRGMIDKSLFSKMKPDALFANTARAGVVNRNDLLFALEQNQIKGAILDVFDHEPPDDVDYKIIRHPKVLATPHIAGATHEVEDHHAEIMNQVLTDWFEHNQRYMDKVANKNFLTVQI